MEHSYQSKAEKEILEEKIKESTMRLNEAQKNEIEIRKEKNRLEQEKKDFELEKQRQLDEERKKIEEEAGKKAAEAERYKIAQLEKKLNDALRVNEEQRRKLEQGSQQSQGEVLELELEDLLKQKFLHDEIIPVAKGVGGADVIQKVIDHLGRFCGQIVCESKKTKAWSEGWIQKTKDDQRRIKADLAVIVIHAEHGIELGTENTWDYATHYDIPKLFIVNALDKDNVKFDHLVDQIKGRLQGAIFF